MSMFPFTLTFITSTCMHNRDRVLKAVWGLGCDYSSYPPPPPPANFRFVNGRCHFLTVVAIIGNQAFQNGRCHICCSLGLEKVETGYNLLME